MSKRSHKQHNRGRSDILGYTEIWVIPRKLILRHMVKPDFKEKALEAKIRDLEQMVGRLTMDNELLKKAMEYTVSVWHERAILMITPR